MNDYLIGEIKKADLLGIQRMEMSAAEEKRLRSRCHLLIHTQCHEFDTIEQVKLA